MSLVADYSTSSSSDSDESESQKNYLEKSKTTNSSIKSTLPSASSLLTGDSRKAGEVFQNRFKQEELNEKASLEHHVKMVENDEHLKMKSGRKICWNHRKGRCRFGSKCQYAHDSDLVNEPVIQQAPVEEKNTEVVTIQKESVASSQTTKRKRPGLGDSIVPGKNVLKAYKQQKQF